MGKAWAVHLPISDMPAQVKTDSMTKPSHTDTTVMHATSHAQPPCTLKLSCMLYLPSMPQPPCTLQLSRAPAAVGSSSPLPRPPLCPSACSCPSCQISGWCCGWGPLRMSAGTLHSNRQNQIKVHTERLYTGAKKSNHKIRTDASISWGGKKTKFLTKTVFTD